jgi:selenocysteine lyase/cysteine desulfurase
MNTDLTKVQDHPATVLRTEATTHSITSSVYITGAETLESYEKEHGVTFAALDNDALEAVREAHEAFHNADSADSYQVAATSLADAVRDLLGLEA